MARQSWIHFVTTGIVVVGSLATAGAAFAQVTGNNATQGSIEGRVVDPAGKPVNEALVVVSSLDTPPRIKTQNIVSGPELVTDNLGTTHEGEDGYWKIDNIPIGKYKIEARIIRKGVTLYGEISDPVQVRPSDLTGTGYLKLRVLTKEELGAVNGVSAAEFETASEKNAKAAREQAALKDSDAALAAGDFDAAIAKLNEAAVDITKCAACYAKIGDIYLDKKHDSDGAEKAYLKAIDLDATMPAPYARLATIYNDERKFDDAGKMSAKANELLEAKGGGDAASVYNQGVALWNQGKAAEAQPFFEKATKLDPKMAEAYFQLGMTLVSQSKPAEAKPALEQYLKLAPKGPNADTAKAILDSIK